MNGKKAYITSGFIAILGITILLLGIYITKQYGFLPGIYLITHGFSLIAFGLNLAAQRHSNAKIERKLDYLLEKKK